MIKKIWANRLLLIWLPLLAVALWLTVYGDKSPVNGSVNQVVPAVQSKKTPSSALNPRSDSKASTSPQVILLPLVPREQLIQSFDSKSVKRQDLFAGRNWTPAPIAVKAPPPPPPMAPPIPFIFLGKKLEGGVWEVFLARGEESFVVREGTVISNTYRIDTISPPNLGMTFMPLSQSQSIAIGESR